jgi:predicted nucleic acid-binding protein
VIHFLDSSALVKRYIEEEGSGVISLLFRGRKTLAVSRLAEVEVPLAIARRARRGDLKDAEAHAQAEHVLRDLLLLRVVELRPRTLERARELGWEHGLRAYDALQLASASRLKAETGMSLTFWSADDGLNDAARAEGLRVGRLA